ncbi:MAG: hypothetical protein ACSLFO_07375 [Acidimicrobiales bacterium]
MSIALVLSWYLGGACAAAWMVRRGHSATPWCIGAALVGALLWAAALPSSLLTDRRVRWAAEDGVRDDDAGRLVVGLVDEPGAVTESARSMFQPDDHLVILHRMGIEAVSSVVETGEQAEAVRRVQDVRSRWPGSAETRVAAGPREAVLEQALAGRRPGVFVRGAVTGWGWRTGVRRSVALGATFGCPVLHAPAAAGRRVPAPLAQIGRHA